MRFSIAILAALVLLSCKKEADMWDPTPLGVESDSVSAAAAFTARVSQLFNETPTSVVCPLVSSDWRKRDCEGVMSTGPVTGSCFFERRVGFLCHVRWDSRRER